MGKMFEVHFAIDVLYCWI